MLATLVRAHQDPGKNRIRVEGMDEREMALASGIMDPVELDTPFYALNRRWRVLEIIREMDSQGWIRTEQDHRMGVYRIWPTKDGESYGLTLNVLLPWYKRLWRSLWKD